MDENNAQPGAATSAGTLMQRVRDWFYATRHHWKRGLLMLLYVLVLGLIKLVATLIAIFQLGYILIFGTPNAMVRDFGASLAVFTGQLIAFLVCADDRPPFPFSDWPRPTPPDV